MPFHASAKKSLRREKKKRLANHSCLSSLRTLAKKVLAEPGRTDLIQANQQALDKAASRGVIHRRTAARRIGRMMRKIQDTPSA